MTQEVSDSKIHFRCSKCQAKYSALPEQSGKKGICKECGAQIKVPNPDSALSKAGDAAITVRRIWIPQTLASGMLVWALYPDNPYGYYILLRWVCCGVFAYLAYQAFDREKQGWVWALGITALFYNPIFSVHLNRELWSIINVVTIGIAVVSIFALKFDKDGQLRGRNGNAEIDLIKDRRRFAEEFILYMFPELLCGIDDDPFMCPSQAAEYANFEHEQRGDDSHADPRIVSVAYGCLAGVILLSFEQFLRNEMAPKIKSATQIAQEKMTDEILSVAAWPGFEDEVINGVKEKLYEWGSKYGVSMNDAGIRIRSFIHEYEKSDCTKLFCSGRLSEHNHSFLDEDNFRKYTNFSEHVAIWLCSPNQFQLQGLLNGFFSELLKRTVESSTKSE